MKNTTFHQRWLLEVPKSAEDATCSWLLSKGCTATYRDMQAPFILYAYFPPNAELPNIENLKKIADIHLIRHETFADQDWLAKSREGFNPINIGRTLRVSPVWADNSKSSGRISITVNPGLAFGTGGHETTRLCMTILEDLSSQGLLVGPVLDIGTGTGILALTSWLLGAKNITAFDYDQNCGPAIDDFLALNSKLIDDVKPFSYFIGTIDNPLINESYNIIIANLLLDTIQSILPRMGQISKEGGLLIASGILAKQQDEALISLTINGFKPVRIEKSGDWIAILASYYNV